VLYVCMFNPWVTFFFFLFIHTVAAHYFSVSWWPPAPSAWATLYHPAAAPASACHVFRVVPDASSRTYRPSILFFLFHH